jgi:hypothetical protein
VALSGKAATAATPPTVAGASGVTATVQNNGSEPLEVKTATYNRDPVAGTTFDFGNSAFVDLQITGATASDSAVAQFYYASDIIGSVEENLNLRYFDGLSWSAVASSGGEIPARNTTDNLDGTLSGGRFTVLFDNTSTPKITELTGTVFSMVNPKPQILSMDGPSEPLALGAAATLSVHYATLGNPAASQITFLWGDGTQTTKAANQAGTASATRTYGAAGVYTVGIILNDPNSGQSSVTFKYVVIYDPSAGFVTGGGWINSPVGAYVPDRTLTGKANFGFVSKYNKGQSIPTGETEFQLQCASFTFQSTSYQWLVVAGSKAQYKGFGQINGAGSYGFLLTATDGDLTGGGGVDKFRIKIWDKATGATVYDNAMGSSEDMDLANPQAIGGGSIVLHK